jgi:hypothetical protein
VIVRWAGAFETGDFGLATLLHFAGHHHSDIRFVAANHLIPDLILPGDFFKDWLSAFQFLIWALHAFLNFFFGKFVVDRFQGAVSTLQMDVVAEPAILNIFANDGILGEPVEIYSLHYADRFFVWNKASGDPHAEYADCDESEAANGAFVAAEEAFVHPRSRARLKIISAVTSGDRYWVNLAALWAAHSTVPFKRDARVPRRANSEHYDSFSVSLPGKILVN